MQDNDAVSVTEFDHVAKGVLHTIPPAISVKVVFEILYAITFIRIWQFSIKQRSETQKEASAYLCYHQLTRRYYGHK